MAKDVKLDAVEQNISCNYGTIDIIFIDSPIY